MPRCQVNLQKRRESSRVYVCVLVKRCTYLRQGNNETKTRTMSGHFIQFIQTFLELSTKHITVRFKQVAQLWQRDRAPV